MAPYAVLFNNENAQGTSLDVTSKTPACLLAFR
ncbi:hypothetical protein VAA_02144 [Vibrio anguillarum 775]|nr:hypothetical protein VAA_02144 [Vibrio anguillarum 775]